MSLLSKEEKDDLLYKEYSMYLDKHPQDREIPRLIVLRRLLAETNFFIQPATAARILNNIMKDAKRVKRLDYEIQFDKVS